MSKKQEAQQLKHEIQSLEPYASYLEALCRRNDLLVTEYRMEMGGNLDELPDMDPEWFRIWFHLDAERDLCKQRIQDAKESLDSHGIPYDETPPQQESDDAEAKTTP